MTQLQLPMEPLLLLPHRPPMLFVKRLLKRYGDKATAEAVVPVSGICIDDNQLYLEYLVELIAQTAAMANGYDNLLIGKKPTEGMLVGVDSFCFGKKPEPGRLCHIKTEKTFEFGPVKVIHGEIWGDELYGKGDIKVWENQEKDGVV